MRNKNRFLDSQEGIKEKKYEKIEHYNDYFLFYLAICWK